MNKLIRTFVLFLCLVVVACPAWAVNDFSGMGAGSGLWTCDNDCDDSFGGNDLVEYNTPAFDAGDKQEGTHSVDFTEASSETCYLADASLDANFPGSNGTSEQDFSVCTWFKLDALVNITLDRLAWADSSWELAVYDDDGDLYFVVWTAGGGQNTVDYDPISTGTWYHVCATFTASDDTTKIRVWDGATAENTTGDAGADHVMGSDYFRLSQASTSGIDGHEDEAVVIAGEALSDADIDAIRGGTYGAGAAATSIIHMMFQSRLDQGDIGSERGEFVAPNMLKYKSIRPVYVNREMAGFLVVEKTRQPLNIRPGA